MGEILKVAVLGLEPKMRIEALCYQKVVKARADRAEVLATNGP